MNSVKTFFHDLKTKNVVFVFIVVGFVIYFNALFNGFVWDDAENIVNNALIRNIGNLPYYFTGSTFNSGGMGSLVGSYYKPLITTLFSLIYTFSNGNPFLFHLISLIIHIANSILIFVIFTYFFKKSLSFVLSLIFLIHPMNVEAVAYASSLEDPLFLMLGLCAFLLVKTKNITKKTGIIISLLMLLSLLAKESGLIMMIVIGFYVYFFDKTKLKNFLYCSISVISVYAFLRFIVGHVGFSSEPVFAMTRLPLFERLKSLPLILLYYLRVFYFPLNLSVAQEWIVTKINFSNFYLPSIISLLYFGAIISLGNKLKKTKTFEVFLFFTAFYLLSYILHWQILPIDLTVADRWFYMPMVGILGILGMGFEILEKKKIFQNKQIIIIFVCLILILLSVRTFLRTLDWKDEAALYSHDIKINRDSYVLESNYGLILIGQGKLDEGENYIKRSIELAPYRWENWTTLGSVYMIRKDYPSARKYYEKAMSIAPYYAAYENYGRILVFHDTPQNAEKFLKKGLSVFPNNPTIWLLYSVTEYNLGNKEEALKAAQISYNLSPNQQNSYVLSTLMQGKPLQVK